MKITATTAAGDEAVRGRAPFDYYFADSRRVTRAKRCLLFFKRLLLPISSLRHNLHFMSA
ncbi:MAG: hypothetical protein JW913_11230 [Chitinispirillaceae bacterium]|nr:hypothetical protein [Chitinispirillaceae bacterium]